MRNDEDDHKQFEIKYAIRCIKGLARVHRTGALLPEYRKSAEDIVEAENRIAMIESDLHGRLCDRF